MIAYKKVIKICSLVMLLSGIVILATTLYPIFSYEWEAEQKYPRLLSPLVDTETASFKFSTKDYTKLNNWFDEQKVKNTDTSDVATFYTVSIPKLNIDNAIVKLGGEDLSNSLIQFPGTAVPGTIGNAVIFGHSVLPQYFDPKRYLTIFSTLNKLDIGDKIYIFYEGSTLQYEVADMFEVSPKDIQVLEQSTADSYISLVTCTPPGHPLKPRRLIIRAKLKLNTGFNREGMING